MSVEFDTDRCVCVSIEFGSRRMSVSRSINQMVGPICVSLSLTRKVWKLVDRG